MNKRSNQRADTVLRRKLVEFRGQRNTDMTVDQDDWDLLAAYGKPWTAEACHQLEQDQRYNESSYTDWLWDATAHAEAAASSLWPVQQALQEQLDGRPKLRDSWPAGADSIPVEGPAGSEQRLAIAVTWARALQDDPISLAQALQLNQAESDAERRLRAHHCAPPKPVPSWRAVTNAERAETQRWRQAWTLAMLACPMWLRPLSEWPGGSRASLLRHLLVEHDPQILIWHWLTDDDEAGRQQVLHALVWFVCQAQAISLRRVASALGWPLPPSAIEAVQAVQLQDLYGLRTGDWRWEDDPWDLASSKQTEPAQAGMRLVATPTLMLAATVHLAGGSARELGWLYDSGCYDRTVLPALQGFNVEATRWLSRHAKELMLLDHSGEPSDEMVDDPVQTVLRWVHHERLEVLRHRGKPFSWKGRTARSALAAARDYVRFVQGVYNGKHASWRAHGWNWQRESEDRSGSAWQIEELLSTEELVCEGAAQRHCVRGYASRCVMGESAILTLRRGEKRSATIEVLPGTREVVQVRGKLNALVSLEVQAAVELWARTMGLLCDFRNLR